MCILCRDSSCACFRVAANTYRYGRILKIYYIIEFDEEQQGAIHDPVILHVRYYQPLNDNQHRFKYATILAKNENRVPEEYISATKVFYKCIFLTHSKLPTVHGQHIYVAFKLMNHTRIDGATNEPY